jgi:hypothetical protein
MDLSFLESEENLLEKVMLKVNIPTDKNLHGKIYEGVRWKVDPAAKGLGSKNGNTPKGLYRIKCGNNPDGYNYLLLGKGDYEFAKGK